MYRIIGADGREYGPISAEQMRQWIGEGRANAATRVLTEGSTDWKALGSLPEFSPLFASTLPQPGAPAAFATSTAPGTKTNGLAITGFVLGVVSFFTLPIPHFCCCFGPLINILGIIFSLVGLSQINRNPRLYNGRGFAIAGLIISILCFLGYFALLAAGGFYSQLHHQFPRHAQPL